MRGRELSLQDVNDVGGDGRSVSPRASPVRVWRLGRHLLDDLSDEFLGAPGAAGLALARPDKLVLVEAVHQHFDADVKLGDQVARRMAATISRRFGVFRGAMPSLSDLSRRGAVAFWWAL
ncbi:MAG TPA: hypothetical protein VFB89_13860 [Gemmatimonadales bacterium]|nr:hypothetical protein [Gemmatimonadales bacterium]